MGSLRFPAGLPAGPLQELFLALHDLHGLAGEPSVREIADAVGCSHHKVHQMFTQPRLPTDGDTLWAVVEWLARQGRRPRIRTEDDEEEFWAWFEEKWSRAKRWVLLEPSGLGIVTPPRGGSLAGTNGSSPTPEPASATKTPPPPPAGKQVDQDPGPRSPRHSVTTTDAARTREDRTPPSSLLPAPQASQAILVGASSFESPDLPGLPSVARGVRALNSVLTDAKRDGAFLPASTQVLIDPTRTRLLEAIEKAAGVAEDVMLFYFAGHGLVTPRGGLALAGRDTRIRSDYTSASWDTVREILSGSRARRSLVILDACYSGRATQTLGTLSGLEEPPVGAHMLSATGSNYVAIAPSGGDFTAFTGALIELLTEGDRSAPKYLTVDVIYDYLNRRMLRDGYPQPSLRSNGSADLALGLNRSYQPPRPS